MLSYIDQSCNVSFHSCDSLPSHRVSYRMESLLVWQIKSFVVLEVLDLRIWWEPCFVEYDFVLVGAAQRCCRASVDSRQLCEVEGVRVKFWVRSLPAESASLAFGVQLVLWTVLIFPAVPELLQAMRCEYWFQGWNAGGENGNVDLYL